METLGITHSVCSQCRALVPAKVITDGHKISFRKFCLHHGESESLVRRDLGEYLAAMRYVKPAWIPKEFRGRADKGCPQDCGFCDQHEQHLCMPIIEITSRCDLNCPACLVDAGQKWDMTVAEFDQLLEVLIRTEGQIDVLNLSGGEPLVHPELLSLLDKALARPEIVRVSISSNGLKLLEKPDLLQELRARNIVLSLQLDGFNNQVYQILRGRPLLNEKLRLLEMLAQADITTSLTMTAAGGINDDQFLPMLEYFFSREHVVSMMIQPLAFAGRGRGLVNNTQRLTIPDIVKALGEAGHLSVKASDFAPLPCSHPLCFSLAFYLMLEDGRALALNRLVEADKMMDSMYNRTFFGLEAGEYQQLKEMIYELWSGPAGSVPESPAVLKTLRRILRELSCCGFDPRKTFNLAERKVKSIFIHAFQDADTFDLARLRRCCNAYPQVDGRLLPACARNVLGMGVNPKGHKAKESANARTR